MLGDAAPLHLGYTDWVSLALCHPLTSFGVLSLFYPRPSVASLRDFTLGYVIPPAMRRALYSARHWARLVSKPRGRHKGEWRVCRFTMCPRDERLCEP